ncbi:DEAD-box ATP-dependent RNA helicase CshA [Clostridium aceticum]|uniref:ATP-dependent RNA helicase CshA n=1 Tax=Clostridium aceticum TaxID=84022 RepID=A0A0D8I8B2_9CLOT|nr:DEAD/DEAH box helicase [Clostridium aceticum]AKL95845.1 DEAD-box ATP-dependent RNA helicase CshA [Clostridium aceticum]KJF25461.1 RNA helicase [Clostridium aceticum]
MKNIEFQDLNIEKNILKAIEEMGFEAPTPIQSQALPKLYEGKDIIGQAQTGTGKTAAFGIPMIEKVNQKDKSVQILILTPTRELSMQVADELRKFAKYLPETRSLAIYGGQPIERQIKALKQGVQIVVGTPGRIIDHIRRKTLKLDKVIGVVLDEADQMLDMGFLEDIETILDTTPKDRQTAMFSATMPREIENIGKKYLKSPEKIKVVHKELTVPKIGQYYFEVKNHEKLDALCRVLDMEESELGMIFCRTKKGVDELVESLQSRGHSVEGLHGDLKQSQRDRVMKKFRDGIIDFLVATDVAARGIDVDDVELVINYDIPEDFEYYVHRIGRTGRAGRTGLAYTFVAGRQLRTLKALETYAKTKIKRKNIPTINDIAEKQRETIAKNIVATIEKGGIAEYTNFVEKLSEDHSSIDIAAALLKLMINKNEEESIEAAEDVASKDTGAEPGMVRMFLNIGKKHGATPGNILGAITGESGIEGNMVGVIDIFDKFTFVEVPEKHANKVLTAMNKNRIKGRKINMEPANKR